MQWLGNAKTPPAETMRDLSDVEWIAQLKAHYGAAHIHIGAPQEGGGHCAAYWEQKGLVGLYLDDVKPAA